MVSAGAVILRCMCASLRLLCSVVDGYAVYGADRRTDWQQGERTGGCAGGAQNPTMTTNMLRGTDHLRRGEPQRDLVLARFGGLGSHRYQVSPVLTYVPSISSSPTLFIMACSPRCLS